jgi:anti-sigma B factor antagonist
MPKLKKKRGNKYMEIYKDDSKKVRLIPEGRIDVVTSQDLKESLLELFNEGYDFIVIDFNKVTSIDSSGLGKLLLFQKKLKERNGALSIVNVKTEYIKNMFKMIHLDKVIDIEYLDE